MKAFNVKLAQRFVCPLYRRVGARRAVPVRERETGMADFINTGGIFAMPV